MGCFPPLWPMQWIRRRLNILKRDVSQQSLFQVDIILLAAVHVGRDPATGLGQSVSNISQVPQLPRMSLPVASGLGNLTSPTCALLTWAKDFQRRRWWRWQHRRLPRCHSWISQPALKMIMLQHWEWYLPDLLMAGNILPLVEVSGRAWRVPERNFSKRNEKSNLRLVTTKSDEIDNEQLCETQFEQCKFWEYDADMLPGS